ncbi:MAG: hypothetical protein WDO17_15670 [Alphaproteobacteria bacterium]
MAGLSDMEELIGTVSNKDISNFLREALACYGTGAFRACIVLTNIALFDDLRAKIKAIAPTSTVAKAVSDAIEPLAAAQKVFETPLIHKLKTAKIISELEAQRLEQLNDHRNKAAHPSGHEVTAEEARFVFSEAIQKFISKPIRQTSYIVDEIISKIADKNFFPSTMLPDMRAVAEHETENLDPTAIPFLISKLVATSNGSDPDAGRNARHFLLAWASKRDDQIRKCMTTALMKPMASVDTNSEFISMLIAADPRLLPEVDNITRQRTRALLLKNAAEFGSIAPYSQLRSPAHILGACLREFGEAIMISEMGDFVDWVVVNTPDIPNLISDCANAPNILSRLFAGYLERASSSQWTTSNAFAQAVPPLDPPLAAVLTNADALKLVAAFVKGADWNGFGPMEIAGNQFAALPLIRQKAKSYTTSNPTEAQAVLVDRGIFVGLADFVLKYIP